MATDIELAIMAGRAYQSTRNEVNWFPTPKGWSIIGHRDSPSGFEAVTFQQGDEIVISYTGTYDKDYTNKQQDSLVRPHPEAEGRGSFVLSRKMDFLEYSIKQFGV